MKIIPAIFIQNGKVVSFYKGSDNEQKKTYTKAAKTYAANFSKQGAKILYVIDIDGNQKERLTEIRENFPDEIWWAGQVRTIEYLDWLFNNGADKIVLGQSAEAIFEEAIIKYGQDKIIAGLKVNHYQDVPDLCQSLTNKKFSQILIKDLNAEGTLVQPNFDIMEKCVYFSNATVYSSGGIGSNFHLKLAKKSGVAGVIIARAFYENQLNLSDLISQFGDA